MAVSKFKLKAMHIVASLLSKKPENEVPPPSLSPSLKMRTVYVWRALQGGARV